MAAIWVGVDDTDSPKGGCTTWVLSELLDEARSRGIDVLGEPGLVRLNPNIPWKTRGNAAVVARFGVGRGRRRRVAEVAGRPVWSFERGRPLPTRAARAFVDAAWERVLHGAAVGEPGTDPALVAVERPLPAWLYWRAVREVVAVAEVRDLLDRRGADIRWAGSDRGLVGAAAATAWRGAHPTWERIAYRPRHRWGRPRDVDPDSVRRAQAEYPALFLCHDARTRRLLVAPHTPCPILYGLRGTTRTAPLRAGRIVVSEPVDRWVLFRSNQGTGDHLRRSTIAELPAYGSGILSGEVAVAPVGQVGGHFAFSLEDRNGERIVCRAFEPTKTLPRVARALLPGDRLRVWGSRGAGPDLRLEGIEVVGLSSGATAFRPPRCGHCGRGARSLGRARGYRCPACRRRWPPEAAARIPGARELRRGVYHPTPSARRHLALRGPETGGALGSESF